MSKYLLLEVVTKQNLLHSQIHRWRNGQIFERAKIVNLEIRIIFVNNKKKRW